MEQTSAIPGEGKLTETTARPFRTILVRRWVLAGLAVAAFAAGCGDDEDDASTKASIDVSTADLSARLVPVEDLGAEIDREFEWTDPIDFVIEGVFHSEATTPSELIGAIDDAGFAAAAGRFISEGEARGNLAVARFGSDEGAARALEILHEEDLKQPCFGRCAVAPIEYELDEIPDAAAVHHVPSKGELPPDLFPFEGYLVEFTVGSDLFVFQMSGPPGMSEEDFVSDAEAVYEHAIAQE